jgi:hypothetical protein
MPIADSISHQWAPPAIFRRIPVFAVMAKLFLFRGGGIPIGFFCIYAVKSNISACIDDLPQSVGDDLFLAIMEQIGADSNFVAAARQ